MVVRVLMLMKISILTQLQLDSLESPRKVSIIPIFSGIISFKIKKFRTKFYFFVISYVITVPLLVYRGSMLVDIFIEWYGMADTKAYPGRIWKESTQPAISPYVAQVFRAVSAYHSVLTDLAAEKKLTLVRFLFFILLYYFKV